MDFLLELVTPRRKPEADTPPPSPTAPAADTFARSLAERRSLLPLIISETPNALMGLMGATPGTAATSAAPMTSSPPATGGSIIPADDMAPIGLSPAPLGAEMAAALAVAAAAADSASLHAIIQDLKHAAVIAARDAENAQLRSEMMHMQALHAQRMQSDADLKQAQQAVVSSAIIGDAAITKPSDARAEAVATLVNDQLGKHITPAIAAAHLLDDDSSVEDISRLALRITGAAAVVPGGKQYKLTVATILGLSGQHAITDIGSLIKHQVQDILAACRNVGDADLTVADDISIADSNSSSSDSSTASGDIFTGPNAVVTRTVY